MNGMSIEDFCRSYLVSLLDITGVKYYLNPNSKSYLVDWEGSKNYNNRVTFVVDPNTYSLIISFNTILWSDINFELIPFLSLLNTTYKVDMTIMYYKVVDGITSVETKAITIKEVEYLDDKYYIAHFWINIDRGTF